MKQILIPFTILLFISSINSCNKDTTTSDLKKCDVKSITIIKPNKTNNYILDTFYVTFTYNSQTNGIVESIRANVSPNPIYETNYYYNYNTNGKLIKVEYNPGLVVFTAVAFNRDYNDQATTTKIYSVVSNNPFGGNFKTQTDNGIKKYFYFDSSSSSTSGNVFWNSKSENNLGQVIQTENIANGYSKFAYQYNSLGNLTGYSIYKAPAAIQSICDRTFIRDNKTPNKLINFYNTLFGDLNWFTIDGFCDFKIPFHNENDFIFSKQLPLKISTSAGTVYHTNYNNNSTTSYYNYSNVYDANGDIKSITEYDDQSRVNSIINFEYN